MADFELFALVLGDSPPSMHVFSITAKAGDSVAKLRKEVGKKNRFKDVEETDLVLWKLNNPVQGDETDAAVTALGDLSAVAEKMMPIKDILHYFPAIPQPNHLHIIVVAAATTPLPRGTKRKASEEINTVAAKRLEVIQDSTAKCSPSILAQGVYKRLSPKKFVLNRPPLLETVPLAILDPIIGQFMEDADTYIPTATDNALVRELREVMSKTYNTEREYCSEFRRIVTKHYPDVHLMAAEIGSSQYTSDGHLRLGEFMYSVNEFKCWDGKGDPEIQAAGYYIESARQFFARGDYPDRLPCMIIYCIGPLICFAGAVLTDRLQLETLVSPLVMHTSPHESKVAGQAARTFGAFRHAAQKLREHYRELTTRRNLPSTPEESDMERLIFPYQGSFTDFEGKRVEFTYVKRLFPDKLMFTATANELNILIKFTRRYSKDAHRLCADKDVAPKLHAVERLAGGWMMVAMDYLDPQVYSNLYPPPPSNPALLEKIKEVGSDSSQRGIYAGTINKVMLVDFDWAGVDGKVHYPAHINPESRPIGVSDGQTMEKKHDLEMIDYIFR